MRAEELISHLAEEREASHANRQFKDRPLSPDFELVGLVGEAEFASAFGVPIDLRSRPEGDRGIDFVVPLRFTVDVKCSKTAGYLICLPGKVTADIFVLAKYVEPHRAELIGWEWGHVLARAPIRDLGYGVPNHCIPRANLRPISALNDRVMRLK